MSLLALCSAALSAQAGIVFYSNRADFLAASGTPSFVEDFEGFASDASFVSSPVAVAGGSFLREGTGSAFRNLIDVPPRNYPDSNGTAGASLFTDFGLTSVRFTFASLNRSFGFESTAANDGVGAVLQVYNGTTLLGSVDLTNGDDAFAGYTLSDGDVATSVRFVSARDQSAGEGYFVDNLVGSDAAPTVPGPLAALPFALIALNRRRKRA